jgi:Ca2+-binding EF-hand superfamily protein
MTKALKRLLTGTAILAALAVPGLVGAMSGPVGAQSAPQENSRVSTLLDELVELLDTDRNGTVDAAEIAAAKARPEAPEPRADAGERRGRGTVTRDEFMARAETRFARMDANGDGRISPDERREARKERRRMHDEHRHGRHHGRGEDGGRFEHARHERGPGVNVDRMFKRFDANGDGMISREEVEAAKQKWHDRRDGNRD